MTSDADAGTDTDRLVAVSLDPSSIGAGSSDQEHERRAALSDLLAGGLFALAGHDRGPYGLVIGLVGGQLALDIRTATGAPIITHLLSLKPFRSLFRDYLMVCDSHATAMRTATTAAQIEAIDMGRRGLHNEGAERLGERLHGKITADLETLRRLFTVLTALQWKG